VSFDDDDGQTVDSGDFEIYKDGELLQSGALSVDSTGRVLSFRFNATTEGQLEIVITWRVGQDVWKQPFLMKVVRA